ncbi:membrane protein insertase YidC [Sediminitomix flava]|uniref:Membrane protein insertase YidC n=1 Tax=Sediminitomix flava TaxID=379075 RepID=A0A315ZC18_SEDFL|nr:membrane protein insertase YidC [Sediminitomix flava]PWJ43081.1 YidC/Oxa1 family membrane protein insertase [Sediminitomix flava]
MENNKQTLGFILITAMLGVYMFWFAPEPVEQPDNAVQETTSVVSETATETTESNNTITLSDSALQNQYGLFAEGVQGTEKDIVLENNDVKVILSTKGGTVKEVLLKNFTDQHDNTLKLITEESSNISEVVTTDKWGEVDLNKLYYQVSSSNSNEVTFTLRAGDKPVLNRTYRLESEGFIIQYENEFAALKPYVTKEAVTFRWVDHMRLVESDMKQSRMRSTVNYYATDDSFDYLSQNPTGDDQVIVDKPLRWVSMKQKFFNSSIITDKQFNNADLAWTVNEKDTSVVKTGDVQLSVPFADFKDGNIRFYFGPNDYDICDEVTPGFEQNVYLGWGIFGWMNRIAFIPLFKILASYISNYGVVIFIMVLLIKSILFPLTYKSYLSMAKTKVLKPQIDEIKERVGEDDPQKVQMETMKLYQQVGVNPLSGCIPMLFQMPIFLALYNLFPNALPLRHQSFLWAEDLTTYDSILNLPFEIPFYGDHVSLFTLLMTASTLIYTHLNNKMNAGMQAQQGPMKAMSYVMPVMFLFVLNGFAAALTYYYFVSNLITISQQTLAKRFINEDKILAKLEENKKRNASGNKKKSGFQVRLQEAMKAAQEQQEAQNKKKKGGKK